jgi:predicted esterase
MSQGGVMSLYFGLSAHSVPAGVISFSGYLLRSASLANLAELPMLLVHGHRDGTIR